MSLKNEGFTFGVNGSPSFMFEIRIWQSQYSMDTMAGKMWIRCSHHGTIRVEQLKISGRTWDQSEGEPELLLQHVELEVQVSEGRIAAPQWYLGKQYWHQLCPGSLVQIQTQQIWSNANNTYNLKLNSLHAIRNMKYAVADGFIILNDLICTMCNHSWPV